MLGVEELPVVLGVVAAGVFALPAPGLLGGVAGRVVVVVVPVVLEATLSVRLDEKNSRPPRIRSAARAMPAHMPAVLPL